MKKTDADKLLAEARKRIKDSETYDKENRTAAREDLEFIAGDQWDEKAKEARKNRPCLTINRMPQFVKQVTGDIRQADPAIKVRPVDSKADPEIAEIYQGLIRNIETVSNASEAYAVAADSQVGCGEGHWRIITKWTSDDSWEQDIEIIPIQNPFSVHYDPTAKRKTREDGRWAGVSDRISKDQFKAKYPQAKVVSWESGMDSELLDWFPDDTVRIFEYFYKVPETKILALMPDGSTLDITDFDVPPEGALKVRSVKADCIYRCVMSGAEILEKPTKWPGRYIPIVRLVGEEIHTGSKTVRFGLIRNAKDSQRAHNYTRSAEIETVALQPKTPWVVAPEGIKGFEKYWNSANTSNLSYLPYNYDQHPAGPQRQTPPVFSQGWAQLSAENADDMKATTGIYDSSLGQRSNETSGIAIARRDAQADVGTYVYHANLELAIQLTGKILIDLIPKIYDTERVIRILGEDDSEKMVRINQMLPTGETANDLTLGKYDVVVNIGPSYSTKRQEAADSMLQATQANPALWNLIGDLIAKNWDWPGADDIAERLKKALPPGLVEDNEDDPTAPYKAMIQQLQQQIEQMKQAPEMMKAQADYQKSMTDAENKSVDTDGKRLDNAQKQLELASQTGQLQSMIQQAVTQAVMQTLRLTIQ